MQHRSSLFGTFDYSESSVLTFPSGLIGFEEYTRFVMKRYSATDPISWLLSVEYGGPEFAVVKPERIMKSVRLSKLNINDAVLAQLGTRYRRDLRLYAIVTLPERLRDMSMNLRTPVLINPEAHIGVQYPEPGFRKKPVRQLIYREVTGIEPDEKTGRIVLYRGAHETVDIGENISVEIMEFLGNGAVRLGVTAPKDVKISRSETVITPLAENMKANKPKTMEKFIDLLEEARIRKAERELEEGERRREA